jgi:hypothetical protein
MATAVVARPVARPQARARDEEVLVWPDLVFVEFISALLFSISLFILAILVNAPLLDQANSDVTPNPSKAPWYLLNLQELLLHMNPAMAGVIIPTIWLGIMAAFPYFDRETEGQGEWFGTERAVKITIVAGLVGIIGTWALILWDSGKLAQFMHDWFGFSGGDRFRFMQNVASFQSLAAWPEWSTHIPYLPFNLKVLVSDAPGSGATQFQHINVPNFVVAIAIPIIAMTALPSTMIYVMWRLGWVETRRDALLALFSGFVGAYGILTLVGTAFRGQGQELVFPWELQVSEGIPGQR